MRNSATYINKKRRNLSKIIKDKILHTYLDILLNKK